jgi:hypothetical protein
MQTEGGQEIPKRALSTRLDTDGGGGCFMPHALPFQYWLTGYTNPLEPSVYLPTAVQADVDEHATLASELAVAPSGKVID